MNLIQYFYGNREMSYFEKLKTDFFIIHLFILIPILISFTILDFTNPTDNFIIAFSSKVIIFLFMLISLIIIKKSGIKIAGKLLVVGISAILIVPINILPENIPAIYKYTNGFYSVLLALVYSAFFANRTLLLINSFLITITSTHVYLFAITQTPDNTIILESGYFNHLFMVVFITVILFFMHKFSELAINKANNETKAKEQKNKELILANQKIKESEAKLKRKNNELEIKVQERTYKLKEQNEGLLELTEELKVLNEELAEEIEERQAIESDLKDNQLALENSNNTKDKFFSIISHDLKSPFHTMLNFVKLLVNNFTSFDVPKQKKFLGILAKDMENTYSLIENLLLWARTQREIIDFHPKKQNLNLLAHETIELLIPSALEKTIVIINKTPKDINVNADRNMLLTILRNLISNAIKFSQKEGKIIIEAGIITDKDNKSFAEISVSDNGVGMPPEKQDQLFKITKNISTKGTKGEQGTGLGLVLCKEFIEKHEGIIRVESEIEKGSKFIFTLPIN